MKALRVNRVAAIEGCAPPLDDQPWQSQLESNKAVGTEESANKNTKSQGNWHEPDKCYWLKRRNNDSKSLRLEGTSRNKCGKSG